jgi:hypothetical protein
MNFARFPDEPGWKVRPERYDRMPNYFPSPTLAESQKSPTLWGNGCPEMLALALLYGA